MRLPEELWRFCAEYTQSKGLSLKSLLTELLEQGISATADAEQSD